MAYQIYWVDQKSKIEKEMDEYLIRHMINDMFQEKGTSKNENNKGGQEINNVVRK